MGNAVGLQRAIAVPALMTAGVMSLPLSAWAVEREAPSYPSGREGWILPVQFGAMATVGAVVGALLPGLAGASASRLTGAGVGALAGIGAALVSDAAWWLAFGRNTF